jgi:beta-mannosidase
MTPERYRQDAALLREANLNTVHPFAVVEKQAFYDECDRAGLLVYQDFPMWLTMQNSGDLARRATAQLRELIEQFGHHPSIGIWNFGSQPSPANFKKLGSALLETARALDPGRILHQANAYVSAARADPVDYYRWSRATLEAFQAEHDWRVDTHQYWGWYTGDLAGLESVPLNELQLVTEYGAQALPERGHLEEFIPPEALWPPRWPDYTRRCFQPEYQFAHIKQPASLEQFIHDSQDYQARFIQYHTEYYRRRKYAPCNGAHLFCFNDCWPAITWSVVDYRRGKKAGFYALQRAMAPLQAFIRYPSGLRPGQDFNGDVAVVNDYPRAFEALRLEWLVEDDAAGVAVARGEMACRAPANALSTAGWLRWQPERKGRYSLYLRLFDGATALAENVYRVRV